MNAPNVSYEVAKRFQELRRRFLAVHLGIIAASAATGLILLWLVLAVGDYYWEWTSSYRTAGLVVGVAAIVVLIMHRLFALIRDTRQRRFAAQLENSFEDFGQRIRTVLDTVDGRVSGPDEMLSALGHQTLGRWETLSPSQLIPSRTLLSLLALSLFTLLVGAGMFVVGGDMRIALLRALGREIPYTNLAVTPGNAKFLEGASVEVSLELTGRTNRDVMLRHRELPTDLERAATDGVGQDGPSSTEASEVEWIESELLSVESEKDEPVDERRARFAAGLGKAERPIEYQFVTSIGSTPVYRINVQPLIQAERIETEVQPPAYTRLVNRSFASTSITVLERSEVRVTIETNHPLKQATLQLGPKPSKLHPTEIQAGDDPTQWSFEIPSTASLHWKFTGAGYDGTPMTPVKGRLRVRRDAAPTVTWRDPSDEIRVHTLAELPMRVQISDDYGISESGIVFQLGGDDEYVLADWVAEDPETGTTNTTRVKLEQVLPLESFQLSERDYISYYAYAVDNREGSLQRVESDVRYIDIRPLRQFYAEIERDPNNANGGGVIVQLDEIIRRQRFLINRTRRLLRSTSVDLATRLGTIDRMVESQSELAGLTRFLAEFFVSRGNDDVEALSQAEAAMLQAADSLAAGSFDLALVQEEDALRALAEARRSLEILLLKNPTLQQRQALQRLARQLRQKLRRERPETEQELADNLQRIAAEQMQLARNANQLMTAPPNAQSSSAGAGGDGQMVQREDEAAEQRTEQADQSPAEEDAPQSDALQSEASSAADAADPASDATDASTASDGSGSADPSMASSEEPSVADQQDELYARQTDLLERVRGIEDELADRLASSPLMTERLQQATSSMDDLATQVREGELRRFAAGSREVADQLREIGMQLDALATSEPVSRVSAMRDMTTSLANMESDLANQQRSADSQREGQGSGRGATDVDSEDAARLARRLQRRTETIEDILRAPVDVGDVETSEVNDLLQRLVEETEFLQQLEESRNAAERIAENAPNEEADEASIDDEGRARAMEYAETARMMDELYHQLVTPRLSRLQRIEQRATRLAQQAAENGGGESDPQDPETQSEMRMLQKDLEEEGLTELAELLSETAMEDEDLQALLKERFGMGSGPSAIDILDLEQSSSAVARLMLVTAGLQDRIQEMILLEISADRDAPVPAKYRRAVDGYFRELAGNADTVDPNQMTDTGEKTADDTQEGGSR